MEETKDPKKKMQVGTGGQILGKKDTVQMVSVKPILEAFKSNTAVGKDVKKQYARMKELEKGDENNIHRSQEMQTFALQDFSKAFQVLFRANSSRFETREGEKNWTKVENLDFCQKSAKRCWLVNQLQEMEGERRSLKTH